MIMNAISRDITNEMTLENESSISSETLFFHTLKLVSRTARHVDYERTYKIYSIFLHFS